MNHQYDSRSRPRRRPPTPRHRFRDADTTSVVVRVLAILLLAAWIAAPTMHAHRSRWSEAKANVGLINSALKVIKAENNGRLTPYSGGNGAIVWKDLDLNEDEFNSDNFVSTDYTLMDLDKEAGTYKIKVQSRKWPGAYIIDLDGVVVEDTTTEPGLLSGCGCP